MKSLVPYINFEKDTEKIFEFYANVLRGEITSRLYYRDLPSDEMPADTKLTEEDRAKILHMELSVNGQAVLLGSDILEVFGSTVNPGNNISITIEADDKVEADRLFAELSEGGEVSMPMDTVFWDAYFGSLKDRYGITWLVNCSNNS